MSRPITKNMLYNQVDHLNQALESAGSHIRYSLSSWAPGDGWTRYQLRDASGANDYSLVCDAASIYKTLYALQDFVWRMQTHN